MDKSQGSVISDPSVFISDMYTKWYWFSREETEARGYWQETFLIFSIIDPGVYSILVSYFSISYLFLLAA
jgi:hypothetical protein